MSDEALREASDPTTASERLRAMWLDDPVRQRLGRVLARNPSLPLDLLRRLLLAGFLEAWHNPSVGLLVLGSPEPELVAAAIEPFAREHRERFVHRPAEDLLRLLAAHVEGRGKRGGSPDEAVARRIAGVFGLPWPVSPGV